MKKSRKGDLDMYVAVPIGVVLIFVLVFATVFAGDMKILQSHVLVQQKFTFESTFSNLIGQSNQILILSESKDLNQKMFLSESVKTKLSNVIGFLIHSEETDSKVHYNVTNPESETVVSEDLKNTIKEVINATAKENIPQDIYYSIKVANITVKTNVNFTLAEIENIGMAIFPIPVPGELIRYYEFTREGTNYNLILVQED